ncbi:MAG: DUF2723 domain-containing protein [bacterium]
MTTRAFDRAQVFAGPLLGVGALVLYLLSLCPGAYPGESASYMVQAAGLIPKTSPANPVWAAIVWLLLQIPVGGIALKVNLLSAVCGAASVGLLYRVVADMVFHWIGPDSADGSTARIASTLAGVAAAVSLAFSIPFWMVSTRAHPVSLGLLLLMACVWLLVKYAVYGGRWQMLAFAFLYGVGMVESATLVMCAPFFGLSLLYLMLRNNEVRPIIVAEVVGLSLAGLSLSLVAAWLYCGSPGFTVWGYSGWFDVLWTGWKTQYYLASASIPRNGWLLVLIMTIMPFLAVVLVARRALSGEQDIGFYLLHVVMAVVLVMVVLDLGLSPWQVTSKAGILLVAPYLLTACLAGYMAAYCFMLFVSILASSERIRPGSGRWAIGLAVAVPLLILLLVAAFRNLPVVDARPVRTANAYARQVVAGMGKRSWLITDGRLDNLFMIAAADAGRKISIVCPRRDGNELYMKYVASLFESPRLRTLAEVGLMPLLQTWFRSDSQISSKVCVLGPPDIFAEAGLTAVPNKLSFIGCAADRLPDPAQLMEDHRAFWRMMVPRLGRDAGHPTDLPRTDPAGDVRRRVAFVANNLGVYMEDQGRTNDAAEAYGKAREIDPDNVSALLNLAILLNKGVEVKDGESVKREMEVLIASSGGVANPWELSRMFGYVRTPSAFVGVGRVWAQTGQTGLAAAGVARGAAMLSDGGRDDLAGIVAGMYVGQADDLPGEAACNEILAKDPGNKGALLGLARIALRRKHLNRADELLTKAESAGADMSIVAMERAALSHTAGKSGDARLILEKLLADKPDLLQAWVLLCGIMVQENDMASVDNCLAKMAGIKGSQFYVALISGHIAMKKGNRLDARVCFEKALRATPNNLFALQQLLRLDLAEGKTKSMGASARAVLRIDPRNPLANYAMGCVQTEEGSKDLAENSLRTSLEGDRLPAALNNLAWLLQERGAFEEAEKLAREAIATSGRLPRFWDTLGVILMKTARDDAGRLAEAEQALNNAMAAAKDAPELVLHMATLQEMKGDRKKARTLLDTIAARKDALSKNDRRDMERLAAKLGTR